jgi:hypothetical protein
MRYGVGMTTLPPSVDSHLAARSRAAGVASSVMCTIYVGTLSIVCCQAVDRARRVMCAVVCFQSSRISLLFSDPCVLKRRRVRCCMPHAAHWLARATRLAPAIEMLLR